MTCRRFHGLAVDHEGDCPTFADYHLVRNDNMIGVSRQGDRIAEIHDDVVAVRCGGSQRWPKN